MKFDEIIRECRAIAEEAYEAKRQGRELTQDEALSRIARAARLFAFAHKEINTRADAIKFGNAVENALFIVHSNMQEGPIKKFLGGGHGVENVLLAGFYDRYPMKTVKELWLYNYFHWSGLVEAHGISPEVGDLKNYLKKQGASIDNEGRIKVTSKLIERMTRHTPHLVWSLLADKINIRASGSARLSHAEVFELLRDTSNELRSLSLKKLALLFHKATNNPTRIRRAAEELSKPEKIAESFGIKTPEKLEAFLIERENDSSYTDQLGLGGQVNPRKKEEVIRQLLERDYASFSEQHLSVLAKASKLPFWYPVRFFANSIPPSETKSFLSSTTSITATPELEKTRVKITLDPRNNDVRITGTGLGKVYERSARARRGAGTSAPVRDLIAPNRKLRHGNDRTKAIPWPERRLALRIA